MPFRLTFIVKATNHFRFAVEISTTIHYKYTCRHVFLYPSTGSLVFPFFFVCSQNVRYLVHNSLPIVPVRMAPKRECSMYHHVLPRVTHLAFCCAQLLHVTSAGDPSPVFVLLQGWTKLVLSVVKMYSNMCGYCCLPVLHTVWALCRAVMLRCNLLLTSSGLLYSGHIIDTCCVFLGQINYFYIHICCCIVAIYCTLQNYCLS